ACRASDLRSTLHNATRPDVSATGLRSWYRLGVIRRSVWATGGNGAHHLVAQHFFQQPGWFAQADKTPAGAGELDAIADHPRFLAGRARRGADGVQSVMQGGIVHLPADAQLCRKIVRTDGKSGGNLMSDNRRGVCQSAARLDLRQDDEII